MTQAQRAIGRVKAEKPCRMIFEDGSVIDFIACFGSSVQGFCFANIGEANKDKKEGRKS